MAREKIRGPQYAFKTSMFMCPAVHMSTRNLLRSSSTHEPSDPPPKVVHGLFALLRAIGGARVAGFRGRARPDGSWFGVIENSLLAVATVRARAAAACQAPRLRRGAPKS